VGDGLRRAYAYARATNIEAPDQRAATLELIRLNGEALTGRQLEVLRTMADRQDSDAGELVYERGQCWLDLERVAPRTLTALLRACAIRAEHRDGDTVERYTINETGLALIGRK
jgi:hypothetical protein